MNISKIKFVLNDKNINVSKMCSQIGISEIGYYQSIRQNAMNNRTLEKIANYLGIPTTQLMILLDENEQDTVNDLKMEYKNSSILQKEISIMELEKQLIQDKINLAKRKIAKSVKNG
jgi:transcriptional regulator with XRE-family HTH domain